MRIGTEIPVPRQRNRACGQSSSRLLSAYLRVPYQVSSEPHETHQSSSMILIQRLHESPQTRSPPIVSSTKHRLLLTVSVRLLWAEILDLARPSSRMYPFFSTCPWVSWGVFGVFIGGLVIDISPNNGKRIEKLKRTTLFRKFFALLIFSMSVFLLSATAPCPMTASHDTRMGTLFVNTQFPL